MCTLNESTTRTANHEDKCKGVFGTGFRSCKPCISYIHVGQSRFKSQALLDEKALIACMVYVDLNPVQKHGGLHQHFGFQRSPGLAECRPLLN